MAQEFSSQQAGASNAVPHGGTASHRPPLRADDPIARPKRKRTIPADDGRVVWRGAVETENCGPLAFA